MSEIQGKPVYGTCDCKERRQVLSVEQTTDLIQQMASNEWQVPADYIPKTSVNGIIEQHNGDEVKLWIGTQAEYDSLTEEEKAYYLPIISDDPTYQEIMNKINSLNSSVENVNARLDKLGFKEGELVIDTSSLASETSVTLNTLKRQGNYVIGDFSISTSSTSADSIYDWGSGSNTAIQFPKEFIPKNKTMTAFVKYLHVQSLDWSYVSYFTNITITDDGYLLPPNITSSNQYEAYYIKSIKIQFGYEAEPIE